MYRFTVCALSQVPFQIYHEVRGHNKDQVWQKIASPWLLHCLNALLSFQFQVQISASFMDENKRKHQEHVLAKLFINIILVRWLLAHARSSRSCIVLQTEASLDFAMLRNVLSDYLPFAPDRDLQRDRFGDNENT